MHRPTQEDRRKANLQLEREARDGTRPPILQPEGVQWRTGTGHVLAQLLPRGERETLSSKCAYVSKLWKEGWPGAHSLDSEAS